VFTFKNLRLESERKTLKGVSGVSLPYSFQNISLLAQYEQDDPECTDHCQLHEGAHCVEADHRVPDRAVEASLRDAL